jgi:small nuclear ribonucleoprotein (snRNP)-like protein
MGPPNKANAAATSSNGGLTPPNQPNASAMLMMNRDKMLSLSAGLVGQKVTVKMTTGTVVEGVYHTFTPFQNIEEDRKNRYVLKEAKVIVRGNGSNDSSDDDALKDRGDGSTLSIPISKVLHLHATKVSLDYKNGGGNGVMDGITNGFATDVQISGNGSGGSNRDLVAAGSAWTSAGANSGRKPQALGITGGLSQPVNSRAAALGGPGKATAASPAASNKGGDLSGSIGQWDQFKANEELFNVNATFDENLYTTQLDTSQIDARKIAEAERIAREIEGTATTNIHLKEERGQKIEMDFDEEDLYSGVLTEDMKQRHEAASKASSKSKTDGKFDSAKSSSAKKMNYAAALAKAETPGKPAAPGFTSTAPAPAASNDESADEKKEKATEESKGAPSPSKAPANAEAKANDTKITTETSSSDQKDSSATEPAKDKSKGNGTADKSNDDAPHSKSEEKDAAQKDESKDDTKTTEVKKTSKLNANAKTFTFNPSAKSFTPSFGGSAAPSSVHVPPQHLAPPMADPNMQMYAAHPMAHPYMAAAPMGQPGKLVYCLFFD